MRIGRSATIGEAHTPLRDQIREELRIRIADGRLPPGVKMVERELAEELGVSRVPVREALRMLESEGFVQVIPRKGVIVRRLSRHDVEELFDVREALEVLAARRAAECATDDELAVVKEILEEGQRVVATDPATAQIANERFHDALLTLAHNSLLAAMLEPLQGRLHWLFRQNTHLAELAHDHREMYDAIAARDPERAAKLALTHVQVNRELALRLLFEDESASVSTPT